MPTALLADVDALRENPPDVAASRLRERDHCCDEWNQVPRRSIVGWRQEAATWIAARS
jgi:hypothetical protein